MVQRKTKPMIQFSKKLITAVMIFWCIVRLFSVVAAFINPESAAGMVKIVEGIDQIAMVNCLAYTSNSISEKVALGYFQYKQAALDTDDEKDDGENKEVEVENG